MTATAQSGVAGQPSETLSDRNASVSADWMPPYFSIPELAARWRCSRGTVYNVIRGEKVLDFAAPGRKGKKLVPCEVVRAIEQRRMRVWR